MDGRGDCLAPGRLVKERPHDEREAHDSVDRSQASKTSRAGSEFAGPVIAQDVEGDWDGDWGQTRFPPLKGFGIGVIA
jgi:hypothetical protein